MAGLATGTAMTSEKPKKKTRRKRYKSKLALQDSTEHMLPQTQPADHIKSSSSTKYTEHCVADKVAEIPKQVNTVSGVDAAPRKKRQRSHWKSRRRNKAFTTQDNNITDTKAPLPEGPSASALSAQAPSVMAVVKIDEVESSTSTRSRRSLKSLNHSASTLSSQDTCGLAGRSCQPQDPSLSRQDPTDTATLSACERVAPTSQPQVSFLSRQELDDTVTSPPTPPSFHPTFSRQIHHGWPRFIHGEGIVTFSSINLRTKISCTVDPTGVVLSATLPLIRTDSAHVDDQQQALSTSALTALRSNLAATVNGKTEQASTIAQGIIRCSNHCARKVSKSEPDMSKHERSAMPGLPQEPKEQDVQRHGGLDTEVNKRQFLAKVHLDALREKYGRSKTGISSISNTADASSTTDQTSLKFHVLPGNTVISAQEHATVDPKMSGQAANMNASGSTTKSVLQDGTAPTKPIESMPAANACKEPNIVVLESREAKTPPKVEPAPELKPMPPVENVTSHNVTFKGQVRPNKETYVPPHLRYLTDTGAVKPVPSTYEKSSGSNAGNSQAQSSVPSQTLLSKTGPPQLLQHKQQISSAKAGKKPFVPPHLRHLTDDGTIEPIHSMHEKSSGRNGQETVSVLYEHTALSNAGNSQAQSSVPSQTLPPKKGFPEPLEHKQEISSVKTDKTPFVPPHLRHLTDGVTIEPVSSTREKASGSNEQGTVSDPRDTIALSNTGNSQVQSFLPSHTLPSKTMPPEILEHKQEMSSVNAGKKPMTTIHEVDPDEVFVPPPAKPRTPKALPPPSFEHLLPPHLRNLPKPRFMRTRAQEDAERAAKYVPLDEETVVKRVITRNEASYKPVVELKAPKTLIQELAPNEESGIAIAAEDNLTSTGSKHSHKDSVDSASLDARQQKRWRLFNQGVEAPDLNRYAEAGKGKLNHELADWDDKYASAPRHWDARSQFDGYSKAHKVHIEAWIADRVHEAMTMPFKVNTEDTEWRSGILPASGTRKQWQVYPPDCMMDIVPLEYGPVVHPPELPANDPYSHVTERHEQCSASSSKKFLKEYKAKKRQRQDLKYMRRIELEEMKAAQAARRALQGPKVNIYVRPAQVADIPQITTLYNHYVKNTVHAPELAETNSAEWQERFIRAEKEQLAFLVAVSKGKEIKTQLEKRRDERRLRGQGFNGPRRRANADANRSTYKEILYGFVYAEDHAGKHTMFQHVAEVQVFVDPKHLRLGIGKSLMDRIMPTLDMAHAIRDYTDFVPDDRMSYGEGGTRKIHKILINVGFHIGDEKEFEWRKEWLEQVHDFDHVGIISCLGNKFGKGVNIAQMVKETYQMSGVSHWYPEQPDRNPHRERYFREQDELHKLMEQSRQRQ